MKIEINANRWFDRVNGNTYHSVRVIVDGKVIGINPFEYGYGSGYLQTAFGLLQDANVFPKTGERFNGADADYSRFLTWKMDNRDSWEESINDVKRKKDLVPVWW